MSDTRTDAERIDLEIEDGEGWKPLCAGVFTVDELIKALADYEGMPNPVRLRATEGRAFKHRINDEMHWGFTTDMSGVGPGLATPWEPAILIIQDTEGET